MANKKIGVVLLLALICLSEGVGQLVGGWSPSEVTERVEDFVRTAVENENMKSNSVFAMRVGEVKSVKTQVVAGINYQITYTMEQTDCPKGTKKDLEGCNAQAVQECRVVVYERIWENYTKIHEPSCSAMTLLKNKNRAKRSPLLGGAEPVEVGDKIVLAAVDYVMEDLNSRRNSLYRSMPVDILSINKQVVSGVKYSLTLIIGQSQCRNNGKSSHATLTDCPVDGVSGMMEKCYIEVVHQPWQDTEFTIQAMNCQSAKSNYMKKQKVTNLDANMNQIPVFGGDDHDNAHWGVFENFKQKYNKQYENRNEEVKRFKIFRDNMKRIDDLNHNLLDDATYGVTVFADMAEEEFRKYYLSPKWDLSHRAELKQAEIPTGAVPDSYDWRDHNAVTPVKNQGMCGSCWAFSTTGNIEGQWAVQKSKLVSLSEQELVDCDKLDEGCNGGLPVNAYEEIIRLGGLETENKYPYDGEDEKCKFQLGDIAVYINGSVNISSSEADMAAWLVKNGPISIGINAFAMQFYMGGVSYPFSFLCSPDELDHGVLIVGYGITAFKKDWYVNTEQGWFSEKPYWIVKNSWGSSWGEKGYYLVYRGAGVCGVNKMPTSAIVK